MALIKNILVTGSKGQLGSSIKSISNAYRYNFHFKSKDELDITKSKILRDFLISYEINIIINCAAYTDVVMAEKNNQIANEVNHIAVHNLAKICKDLKIQLIHISTDYVFDGNKNLPYKESDSPNPINTYGKSKLYGEQSILKYDLNKSIIIRTSWLFSDYKDNFVSKVLIKLKNSSEVKIVDNEIGSPTNALDLAKDILEILPKIKNNKTKIYHYSNEGYCSRFDFALKISSIIDSSEKILPVIYFDNNVRRPKFSALNSSSIIEAFDIKIRKWTESLEEHLNLIKLKHQNDG
tara:strand:- start:228 stop:1109 length:882 start_codon:yes stop_codon:yes gene_type:complete